MSGSGLLDVMEFVDFAWVAEADAAPPKGRRRIWVGWAAAAACLCLLIGSGALAAEARAYNEAVQFFRAHELSMEGLSRGDIKEVYRDITTETFSYVRTAEVIRNSAAVLGVEIAQEVPSPEEVGALWERYLRGTAAGAHYKVTYEEVMDEALGFQVLDRSVFEKYDGDTLLWRVEFKGLFLDGWTNVPGGTAVWGYTPANSGTENSTAWLARVGGDGTVLWETGLSHGFQREQIAVVLDDGDSACAVFSRGDLHHLVFSRFDSKGTELSTRSTEVGNQGIRNAARLGEDYVVQLSNTMEGVERIVKVDRDGTVTGSFTYTAEDCDYCITDMAEFGGRLYLSARAVPKAGDGEGAGGRYEIAGVLERIFGEDRWEIGSEELVGLLRDNYTAVLLVCDPGSGTPQTFFSVPGCMGGALSAGEQLTWDVESFSDALFSPATSAYSIRGTCQVYRYSFDGTGALLAQEKTDEIVPWWR